MQHGAYSPADIIIGSNYFSNRLVGSKQCLGGRLGENDIIWVRKGGGQTPLLKRPPEERKVVPSNRNTRFFNDFILVTKHKIATVIINTSLSDFRELPF